MSVNKERPHIFVLPEDGANRQLANGLYLRMDPSLVRQLYVLPPAGGWRNVCEIFASDHVSAMTRIPTRLMVLLVDFDGKDERRQEVQRYVPEALMNRVFTLGVYSEPEDLKRALNKTYEDLGGLLADDCRDNADRLWSHELLRHNHDELTRLRVAASDILFPN